MELSLFSSLMGSQVQILHFDEFLSLKRADPGTIHLLGAFNMGLHCYPRYQYKIMSFLHNKNEYLKF